MVSMAITEPKDEDRNTR